MPAARSALSSLTGRHEYFKDYHSRRDLYVRVPTRVRLPVPVGVNLRHALALPDTSLPTGVRADMERSFGHHFGNVRIHAGSEAAASARSLGAAAYTMGNHVVLGDDVGPLDRGRGSLLLAHELAHVVQQSIHDADASLTAGADVEIADPNDASERAADEWASQVATAWAEPSTRETHSLSPLHPTAAGAPALLAASRPLIQRRTIRESYVTAVHETGPLWDVILAVTNAPDRDTEDLLDFVNASMDGIRDAAASIGPREPVRSRTMRVVMQYRPGSDYVGVSEQAFAKARASALPRKSEITRLVEVREPAETAVPIVFPEMEIQGTVCSCDAATEVDYDAKTFRLVTSLTPLLDSIVADSDRLAAAGAIADEYNTRRGIRVAVDGLQDALIDALPEWSISLHRFFDFHSKLLNSLEHDVGPANIKVRTALNLVEQGELTVAGSPPTDLQVNRIVDFLLTERGTVTATAAVIARARRLFGAGLSDVGDEITQAVLVEYYKQGDTYYARYAENLKDNPAHRPCPGDGGCRFWHNIDLLFAAIGAGEAR